ncbi:hypothetical protein FRB91_010814 [Serendipita sp. 411]|nr:hypothetical protein FRB91_010814 [Serendipita sp. 411]
MTRFRRKIVPGETQTQPRRTTQSRDEYCWLFFKEILFLYYDSPFPSPSEPSYLYSDTENLKERGAVSVFSLSFLSFDTFILSEPRLLTLKPTSSLLRPPPHSAHPFTLYKRTSISP